MNEATALIKETPEGTFTYPAMWGHSGKTASVNQKVGPRLIPNSQGRRPWTSRLQNCEKYMTVVYKPGSPAPQVHGLVGTGPHGRR